MDNANGKLSRRNFLKSVAIGSAASTVLPSCTNILDSIGSRAASPTAPMEPVVSSIESTVASITHTRAVHEGGEINAEIVQRMFDEGIKNLVGKSSLEECWLEIFPGLKSSDVIGIKINASTHRLPTHPEVVNAIVNSLLKIGVQENNIIVWDRFDKYWWEGLAKCGYVINSSDRGVRYIATNMEGVGYDSDVSVLVPSANMDFPITRIVSQLCDYLISVPVLKGGRAAYGVTGSMKNYYGAIALMDQSLTRGIKEMHVNGANPQIPEVFNHPLIRDKNKLCVFDALLGRVSGVFGPPQFINNQLILGIDPVAVDYQGFTIIERELLEKGQSSVLAYATYIQGAAEMGLGTNNPDQIELREISLG